MQVEVCYLVGADATVLWRERSDCATRLPDSRSRWAAIWECRESLAEIAHSHPHGPLAFSTEDLSTMAAIDAALGREIGYCVVTVDGMLRRGGDGATDVVTDEPPWVACLRVDSGM